MPDNDPAHSAIAKATKGAGMGMSSELAAIVGFWANWVLLAALIIGAVATGVVIITGIVKDSAFEKYKLSVDAKVADAKSAGLAAGLTAGHAQAAVDVANVEIAKQKTLTAQAQLETERLKAQLAWRTLTPSQFSGLVSVLSSAPLAVSIGHVASDPESTAFSAQLWDAFHRAGLARIGGNNANLSTDLPASGIVLSGRRADMARMQQALVQAGVASVVITEPADADLSVFVGIKPRT